MKDRLTVDQIEKKCEARMVILIGMGKPKIPSKYLFPNTIYSASYLLKIASTPSRLTPSYNLIYRIMLENHIIELCGKDGLDALIALDKTGERTEQYQECYNKLVGKLNEQTTDN